MKEISIYSMDNDRCKFAYYLEVTKESSKSFYAESNLYPLVYRIEKATGKVFCNGKQLAETCEYEICEY